MLIRVIAYAAALTVIATPTSAQSPCTSQAQLVREIIYDDAAEPFEGIRAVAVTRNGTVVVAESEGNALKVFRPDGTFIRLWGRTGEGPGEYRSITNLMTMGDSVWVFDGQLRRGTFVRQDGSTGLMVTFRQTLPGSAMYGEAYPLGDRFIALPGLFTAALASPEGYRRQVFVVTNSPSAAPREIAPPVIMRAGFAALHLPGGGLTHVTLPTPQYDRVAPAPGGAALIVARGDVQPSGRRFITLTRLGTRGDTLRSFRIEAPRAPTNAAYLNAEFDKLVETRARVYPSEGAARSALRELWKPQPHFWPVSGVFVDNADRTWLRIDPSRDAWLAIEAASPRVLCVNAPKQARLVAATANHVWAVLVDGDGVPRLERYRLETITASIEPEA